MAGAYLGRVSKHELQSKSIKYNSTPIPWNTTNPNTHSYFYFLDWDVIVGKDSKILFPLPPGRVCPFRPVVHQGRRTHIVARLLTIAPRMQRTKETEQCPDKTQTLTK